MKRKDIYIDDKNDKELMPKGIFFISAQLHDLKVRKTIIRSNVSGEGMLHVAGHMVCARGQEGFEGVPSKKKRKSNELLLKRSTNGRWNAA